MEDFRAQIAALLEQQGIQAADLLEVPPDTKLGDYALPCFTFAKERRKAPAAIAAELAIAIDAPFLERVEAVGPYVNFFISPAARARAVLGTEGLRWSIGTQAPAQKILIEYPSPNTNKPLHLGHVRNMVLGSTLAIMLERAGNTVIQVNLNNDRGVHICKSMLAYERWGKEETPEDRNQKSDHFVGDFYVLFEKKKQEDASLEEQAQEMLVRWEHGDPQVRSLWKQMNSWALNGFGQTYRRYHIRFDKQYYESDIYQEGKDIVIKHKDVFVRDETGAYVAPLEKRGLPDKVVLRSDGTSIYMTQDIALTLRKIQDYDSDMQVWVVANEQNLHFQQLFAILGLLGVKNRFHHLSYGMVALPEGRMKSREGRVVDADDVLDELESLVTVQIVANHPTWPQEKVEITSKMIALGAIRFFMNKFDPARDFTFNPQSSLSFEGDSGPYMQYTHARICSILAKTNVPDGADVSLLETEEEQELLRQLSTVNETFKAAAGSFRPNLIAAHLLEIARAFNTFYHACPVLQADAAVRDARIMLLIAARDAISEGLSLLGIDAPDEM